MTPLLLYHYCTSGRESRSDQMFRIILLNFPNQAICPRLWQNLLARPFQTGLRSDLLLTSLLAICQFFSIASVITLPLCSLITCLTQFCHLLSYINLTLKPPGRKQDFRSIQSAQHFFPPPIFHSWTQPYQHVSRPVQSPRLH